MDAFESREGLAIVIGASSLDVVGRLENELRDGISNPSVIRTSFGGVARNVAENLARLGQPVALLSVVGKDRIGQELVDHTGQAGVDVSCIHRTDKFPTGFYMGIIGEEGTRKFAFDDMRISQQLSEAYITYNEDLISQASLIFVDANVPEESMRRIIEIAHYSDIPICADPTSVVLSPHLFPYLKDINIIVPNAQEAAALIGKTFNPDSIEQAMDAARKLVSLGVEEAFISIGENGICYASSETSGHFPGTASLVVDPTGAGDALTAAVLFAHLNEIPLDDAARLAVSAATLTTRYPGTVDPNLTLQLLYDEFAS